MRSDPQPAVGALWRGCRRLLESLADPRVEEFLALAPDQLAPLDWPAQGFPVLAELAAAEPETAPATDALWRECRRHLGAFQWRQTYAVEECGAAFLKSYAWTELLGGRGCFASARLRVMLLALGAQTHYPAHRHPAVELYLPLAGRADWQAGLESPYESRAPGTPIYHPGLQWHATRTGDEPLLALCLWRGALDERARLHRDACYNAETSTQIRQ